jgi:hypothetical protein
MSKALEMMLLNSGSSLSILSSGGARHPLEKPHHRKQREDSSGEAPAKEAAEKY